MHQGNQRRPSRRSLPEVYKGNRCPQRCAVRETRVWVPLNKVKDEEKEKISSYLSLTLSRNPVIHPGDMGQPRPPSPFQLLTILRTSIGAAPTWDWIRVCGHFWGPCLPCFRPRRREGSVGGRVTVTSEFSCYKTSTCRLAAS